MHTAPATKPAESARRTPNVYLAGPVTGTIAADDVWRLHAAEKLDGIATVTNPCAVPVTRERLATLDDSARDTTYEKKLGLAIVKRDRESAQNADVVLANFTNAKSVSIGSIGELFWADAFGKDIIIVRGADDRLYDHAMLNAIATHIAPDLDAALEYIAANY